MAKVEITVDNIDCEVELLDSVCISNVDLADGSLISLVLGQRGKKYTHAVMMTPQSAKIVLARLNVCIQNLPLEV